MITGRVRCLFFIRLSVDFALWFRYCNERGYGIFVTRRRSLCLRVPTVVGRALAKRNRSGLGACAGGGGARPIGWLQPPDAGQSVGRPRGGNRRSNRFPLTGRTAVVAIPPPRTATTNRRPTSRRPRDRAPKIGFLRVLLRALLYWPAS